MRQRFGDIPGRVPQGSAHNLCPSTVAAACFGCMYHNCFKISPRAEQLCLGCFMCIIVRSSDLRPVAVVLCNNTHIMDVAHLFDVTDKVVLVTGGAKG
jgi:hypothetical protein